MTDEKDISDFCKWMDEIEAGLPDDHTREDLEAAVDARVELDLSQRRR